MVYLPKPGSFINGRSQFQQYNMTDKTITGLLQILTVCNKLIPGTFQFKYKEYPINLGKCTTSSILV